MNILNEFLMSFKSFWLRAVKRGYFLVFVATFQDLKSTSSSWNLFFIKILKYENNIY